MKRAPGDGTNDQPKAGEAVGPLAGSNLPGVSGSTDSHYPVPTPAPEAALSELLRSPGSSRRNPSSDILQILANPNSAPNNPSGTSTPQIAANTDDAPTIITNNRPPASPPAPLPLIVSGDAPSIANRRLGHFELIEAIGAGGMAAVLKARDLELGRIVALKILPPEAARDAESVTRFKQEARAAAMLDHENVARVYYCGEDQGLHFIAFEFVEGDNLRVLIDRLGTVPAGDCIRYMIQVAAGLNHAAERGVVHRDIKPSNIIITPDGRAKIVDMGLARHLDSLTVNGGVTQSGVTLGTFDYISPEQALDPRRADVRSDIYSLGCTFYHALTGRPPVPEGTAAKKLHAHQYVDPLDPRLLNPSIPDGLAAVLSGMMAKNPDQRFQTPTDLIAHLKGLMEQMKLGADPILSDSVVQTVPANQSVLPEAPRLRLSWVLGVSAVAIVIAAFAMSTGDSGPRPVPPPWATDPVNRKEDVASNPLPVKGSTPEIVADDGVVTVNNIKQLNELLSKPNAKIQKVQLGPTTFDLRDRKEVIEFAGKEPIELIGSPSGLTKIILTTSSHGLAIKAESLTIRGIRFELHHPDPSVIEIEGVGHALGLAIQAGSQVTLQDCFFYALQSEEETIAVAISSGSESSGAASPLINPPDVKIIGCAFAPTGIALQVPPRSTVAVEDSGFSSRNTAIQVLGIKDEGTEIVPPTNEAKTEVKLSRSSFMLDPASAVVTSGSSIVVTAGYSVFAATGNVQDTPPANPSGTILNIVKSEGTKFPFAFNGIPGQKNAYYQVNPITVTTGELQASSTFEECKTKKLHVEDKDAVMLTQRPWSVTDPNAFARKEPWTAFRLNIDKEPALFVEGNPEVIGAQFHNSEISRRAYASTVKSWPPVKPKPPEPTQKVWYPFPKPSERLPDGTNTDLRSLLLTARRDDVILIKHDGPLAIPETIELRPRTGSNEFRVTFKAAEGYKPILTVPSNEVTLDQPLFRLMSGAVTFEHIQFLLKPSLPRNPFKVSAVTIVGGTGCTFTDCVFTLAEEDEQVAAVVRVADADKIIMAMAEGASRPVPEITFKQCVIRGKGRGVWVEVSRPVKVDIGQTLTAINGPLLLTEQAGKSVVGARSSLKMNRVTALVGGPVMEMKGGKAGEMRASGLVPFDVHVEECLFAAVPNAGQPLVELDGIDPTEVTSILKWQVGNANRSANRYANFEEGAAVVVIRSGVEGATPKEWDWNEWIARSGEPPTAGRPVGKVMFALGPTDLAALTAIKPADVRVTEIKFPDATDAKPDDAGANVKSLPIPYER